jgi:nuclear pore complex protein Nup98-Nup96
MKCKESELHKWCLLLGTPSSSFGRLTDTTTVVTVSLTILRSQARGSMLNRSDFTQQLDIWKMNGLDFNYIEKDRLKAYQFLAGYIQVALLGPSIDWKRYIGCSCGIYCHVICRSVLSFILITNSFVRAKFYFSGIFFLYLWTHFSGLQDTYLTSLFYLMLHANKDEKFQLFKTMFRAFSSLTTIWSVISVPVLEVICALSSYDLTC